MTVSDNFITHCHDHSPKISNKYNYSYWIRFYFKYPNHQNHKQTLKSDDKSLLRYIITSVSYLLIK